jgi:hypothetical protein
MVGSGDNAADAIPPFHVHAGHAFEGFELVGRVDGPPLLLTRCECGEVLDVADARFTRCPNCLGEDRACTRCDGSGQIVDHTALQWRRLDVGSKSVR